MKRVLLASCTVVLSGYPGFAFGSRPDDVAAYVRRRLWIIEQSANLRPPGDMLLIGDSIAERSGLESLCGRPVFNAGVSAARLEDIDALALRLARDLKPSTVIIEIGTNDANIARRTDPIAWKGRYVALIRAIQTAPVIIVPAPAIEHGKSGSSAIDPSHLNRLNGLLPSIARDTGARLLQRPAVDTADGVHLSRRGAEQWRGCLALHCCGVYLCLPDLRAQPAGWGSSSQGHAGNRAARRLCAMAPGRR